MNIYNKSDIPVDLQEYFCPAEIGLEQTPDEYVAEMVGVFREVRRVLRDDGVLFLNLGDSYYHTNPSGPQGKTGDRASRTFTAAGAGGQRVQSCDTSGKAGQGLQGRGSSSQSRHDEHTDAWWSRIDDTDCRLAHEQAAELFRQILASMEELRDRLPIVDSVARQQIRQCVAAMRDQAQIAIHAAERLLSFPASMIAGCAPQLQDGLTPMDTLSVFLSSLQTFAACALRCAGTSGEPEGTEHGTAGNALLFAELAHHIRCTSAYCSLVVSWLNAPYVQAQCTTGAGWSQALKPKDLVGIPWRVAFALQADGWYLRQDIIWHKPNPMPESVKDRCCKSHEYIFLLSKSARYYFDAAAIQESVSAATIADGRTERGTRGTKGVYAANGGNCGFSESGMRNKRDVWTVATQPYKGAHFATFPPALILPCILAGCPDKCCPKCGMGWNRVTETINLGRTRKTGIGQDCEEGTKGRAGNAITNTLVFRAACSCNEMGCDSMNDPAYYPYDPIPGTVLDPFGGSGTTASVASGNGREAITIELNPEYVKLSNARCGLFCQEAHP